GAGFGLKQLFTLEGDAYFSEAYISRDGRIQRAEIIESPKLVRNPEARSFNLNLRIDGETVDIDGENFHTTWIPLGSWTNGAAKGPGTGSGAFASGHG